MTTVVHAFRDEAAEAQRLANALRVPLAFVDVHTFPDGETVPRIPQPARTTIVYRSLYRPNAKLVELLLAVDAWRCSGVEQLVLVAPYLPYMRQDAIFRPGEPVSQRVVASLLDAAFDRIVTVDPHLHRTATLAELFPTSATTHVFGADALISHFHSAAYSQATLVVGPDVESEAWVRRIARPLGLDHATFRKVRRGDAEVEITSPPGLATEGRPVLLVDDICSTGGTLRQALSLLRASGAGPITLFVTHMLGGSDTMQSLRLAGAASILSTDSCPNPTDKVHLAGALARALEEPDGAATVGQLHDQSGPD